MAAQPNAGPRAAAEPQTNIALLLQVFERDTAGSKQKIREILDRDPDGFYSGSVRALRMSNHSQGALFLVSLLMESNLLVRALCDPAVSRQEASKLTRLALQLNPSADVDMIERLANSPPVGASVPLASRLLDILADASTGSRIPSSLMRLLEPIIRAALERNCKSEWRSSNSVRWVQSRLAESDQRARSNAIEALWGIETTEAKEVLRLAARDVNNRVAGNAIFALYRAGDTWALPELQRMATSESPLFRASAAWVMGQSGDPRFSETLARMVGESDGVVRRRAFSALSRLKSAAQARHGNTWRVAGRFAPGKGTNQRQLLVTVAARGGSSVKLLPTQFILIQNEHAIQQYQVEETNSSEPMAVTFLLPTSADGASPPWASGITDSLPWKRPADLWRTSFYSFDQGAGAKPCVPSSFTSDEASVQAALQAKPSAECPGFWEAVREAVQAASAPPRGSLAAVLCFQADPGAPEDATEIAASALASHTVVHAVGPTNSSAIEELCTRTQGSFRTAKSETEMAKLIEEMHLTLLSRYAIKYQPLESEPGSLSVRVFDATGSGEATIV